MAGKEVAKKAESAVAEFNPAMFEADAHLGLKNLDQEDMALPFLKIVSGLDPILDEREDVRKGDIVNTVTGDSPAQRVIALANLHHFLDRRFF